MTKGRWGLVASTNRVRALFPLIVLLLLLAVIGSKGSLVTQRVTTELLIYITVVVGFYIFSGNSGILSFGHVGFMMIGAYVSALLAMSPIDKIRPPLHPPVWLVGIQLPPTYSNLAAALLTAIFGGVVAIPLMRLSGLAAGLATFALLVIVREVVRNLNPITAGLQTLAPVPLTTTLWPAFMWALVAMVGAHIYQETEWGLRLRASREDEVAALASGIDVQRERTVAFTLSAFFVGLGGALYGHFLGAFGADVFFLQITFLTVAMLVIGGVTSLAGAVTGTVVVSVLAEILRRIEDGFSLGFVQIPGRTGIREVGLAILMLVVLTFKPKGITGGKEIVWPSLTSMRERLWPRSKQRQEETLVSHKDDSSS